MAIGADTQQLVSNPVPFARSYQLEALEKALKQNTIVFFETGTGKTLIAIMLLRSHAHLLKKPSTFIAVVLVPTVVLVTQQGAAVTMLTDFKVGKYYGELGVDYWDAATWNLHKDENEVLVMTPQVLLDALRHRFLRLEEIKVLIFDECHNARGKHPYASIMTEFYHRNMSSNGLMRPRIFGMTASPIKAKASNSPESYWKQISELETLMNSKVFTCDSESVLAEYVPFATPKVKIYQQVGVPCMIFESITGNLSKLIMKHELSLRGSRLSESVSESTRIRLQRLLSTLIFCISDLGIWLAMMAAEMLASEETDIISCGKLDISGEAILRAFALDAINVFSTFFPTGSRSLQLNMITNTETGYITSKVMCLIETLLEYREMKDLRCIVFVERIVTAVVIRNLLNEFFPKLIGWRTEYTAGNNARFQSQSRKEQNKIVDEFRKGSVNIIISTSMLEEGLDVQSCNLVIRFDPSATVCSFIQSRGRARMKNSDFVLMVKSGDKSALKRMSNYLNSGRVMRRECLSHSALPCEPLENLNNEHVYEVEITGAIVTLSSSIPLLCFYCSRLPSDGYFKPYPRFDISKELGSCRLVLPNSCPINGVEVQGNVKLLKQLACLEACKQLHQCGELTDSLVPNVLEEAEIQESGTEICLDEHSEYFPSELINSCGNEPKVLYHCYSIELNQNFQYEVGPQDMVLAVPMRLGFDLEMIDLDLDVDRGKLSANIKYIGHIVLTSVLIALCKRFQICLFKVLLDQNLNNLNLDLGQDSGSNCSIIYDYLILPSVGSKKNISIDWKCICSVKYLDNRSLVKHSDGFPSKDHNHFVQTKDGQVCSCMLENSLVCTPHNGVIYCISGLMEGYNSNNNLTLKDGETLSYKKYYEKKHGIKLLFEGQTLLKGKHIFTVQNYLHKCRIRKQNEGSNSSVELPPELCAIVMSPIPISTIYTFSFFPSIMHRIESLLIAANLKTISLDSSLQRVIPTITVLEAITTKNCQEKIHLESLETLGDSFIKYTASQQLFKTNQNHHEGRLSTKREKTISNSNLCKLGCARKITGFIRNEPFEPKTWMIPGVGLQDEFKEEWFSSVKLYKKGCRKLKMKMIADVVEALIGAFLSTGGETAALSFMAWLGMNVDLISVPYTRNFPVNPEHHVNIKYFESFLSYTFRDASLLVEALTHGSYMLPDIPRCYQRLEFLGDAVLDYIITTILYQKYPGLSPGILTDLRSACTNNDFYAQSAFKAGLYKHILHASQDLHRHVLDTVHNMDQLSSVSTYGWDSDASFPKVLGDVIESLAGAIYVDSGYNKDVVFQSLKHLVDPVVTPETLKLHPVRELHEICQKQQYVIKKPEVSHQDGVSYVIQEVEKNGVVHRGMARRKSSSKEDRKKAKILACQDVLKSIKTQIPHRSM